MNPARTRIRRVHCIVPTERTDEFQYTLNRQLFIEAFRLSRWNKYLVTDLLGLGDQLAKDTKEHGVDWGATVTDYFIMVGKWRPTAWMHSVSK